MLKQAVVVILMSCMALVLCSGCRTNGDDQERGREVLQGEVLEGDIALGQRFEDGERIVDVQFDNVLFAYDSFQLASREVRKVECVADYMRSNARVRLISEGHCDERGSREYNMSLGENRALAVRAYLIRLGIEDVRIQTRSLGEERPADPGHNEASWRRNRRVELSVYALD